jgi:hypothetical protein
MGEIEMNSSSYHIVLLGILILLGLMNHNIINFKKDIIKELHQSKDIK